MNAKLFFTIFCVGLSFAATSAKKEKTPTNMDIILERLDSMEKNFDKRTDHLEKQMENVKGKLDSASSKPVGRQEDGEEGPLGITENILYNTEYILEFVVNITTLAAEAKYEAHLAYAIAEKNYQILHYIAPIIDHIALNVTEQGVAIDWIKIANGEKDEKIHYISDTVGATYAKAVDIKKHVIYNGDELEKVETYLEEAAELSKKKKSAIDMIKMLVRELDGKADNTWKKLEASLKNQNKLYDLILENREVLSEKVEDANKEISEELEKLEEPISELPVIQDRVYFISRGVEYLSKKVYSTSRAVNYVKNTVADLADDPHGRTAEDRIDGDDDDEDDEE